MKKLISLSIIIGMILLTGCASNSSVTKSDNVNTFKDKIFKNNKY